MIKNSVAEDIENTIDSTETKKAQHVAENEKTIDELI
jgi:hypothetical protein